MSVKAFLVIEFDVPSYIAYFASNDDWIKLAKIIYSKFIRSGTTPSEETGMIINKKSLGYNADSGHSVQLPGNEIMIARKDEHRCKDFEFWFCEEGTLMTQYIKYCTMIAVTENNATICKTEFNRCYIAKKALTRATIILYVL